MPYASTCCQEEKKRNYVRCTHSTAGGEIADAREEVCWCVTRSATDSSPSVLALRLVGVCLERDFSGGKDIIDGGVSLSLDPELFCLRDEKRKRQVRLAGCGKEFSPLGNQFDVTSFPHLFGSRKYRSSYGCQAKVILTTCFA